MIFVSQGILGLAEKPITRDAADSDRALVARVEARDAESLGVLYDRHSARLLGLAQRILGDTGEAEEVLQEVFLHVWKAAATYDPARGPVLAWLLVATRSRSIDRVRSRRPAGAGISRSLDEAPEAASREDIERDAATREWEEQCRAAISELPADQRRALELAYFEGLTQQEIAEATSSPLGTVKTRVRLGLMKLRERVQTYRKGEGHGS
ncbi:MAG TPA: sigma-70 family RNA polymerase sigma factor [Thermoanaerobaculia bacterium]|nr:sigma-70 family RNA polymerase sigma factor [Thermoanaerobaculia bacterium]